MQALTFFDDFVSVGRGYWRNEYPPFVYKNRDTTSYLPIFFYHDISADELQQHLAYLRSNGYTPVGCDEALTALGTNAKVGKKVMLSFDDGLASLYKTVYPVIQAFQIKIVSYLVPDWVEQDGFVNWDQCREMHESGLVDFQSHSNSHLKRIGELVMRGIWDREHSTDMPWEIPELRPSYLRSGIRFFPIFAGRSLYDSVTVYQLPETFWHECAILAATAQPQTIETLANQFSTLLERYRPDSERQEGEAIIGEMARDLERSKNAIEAELPGHRVEHFAYPWHLNSPGSWQALRRTGFRSAAVGLGRPSKTLSTPGVQKFLRVNSDFLFCLPGNGRASFGALLRKKALRRLRRYTNRR